MNTGNHNLKLLTLSDTSRSLEIKFLEVRPDHAGEGALFPRPSAQTHVRDASIFSQFPVTRSLPRHRARLKGPFAFRHAARSRQIPSLSGRIRPRRGTEGGVYPRPLDDHGRLRRPRLRAASGLAGPGSARYQRSSCRPGSARIITPHIEKRIQGNSRTRAAGERHRQ